MPVCCPGGEAGKMVIVSGIKPERAVAGGGGRVSSDSWGGRGVTSG